MLLSQSDGVLRVGSDTLFWDDHWGRTTVTGFITPYSYAELRIAKGV